MKRVKVNGKYITIPTGWIDVSVEIWLRIMGIQDYTDELELLSAMTGESKEFFADSEETNLDIRLFQLLSWYANPLKFGDIPIPKEVKVGEKMLEIPKDLGYKTLGQKIYMKQKLKSLGDDVNKALPYAFAVYLMPEYTGKKFDTELIDEFIKEHILSMPITTVFPIGSFFLKSLLDYLDWKLSDYLNMLARRTIT